MLRRIVSIKNVGRFERSSASGDVEFRKFTLIYGENGRGKTTLCAILRSAQSGKPSHIVGRRTLGATAPSSVSLLLDDGSEPVVFKDGSWSRTLPNVSIFDQHFVSENVYAGDAVGPSQKRNLYKVIVGAKAVSLADRYDVVVRDIRNAQQNIRDASKAVESHAPKGMSVKAYLGAPEDAAAKEKVAKAQGDLRAAMEVDRLRLRPGIGLIEMPAPDATAEKLLSETLESVAQSADVLMKAHLREHEMRPGGQTWLLQGMEYKPELGCPFCGQDLRAVPLLDAYRVVFSDAYRALKDRITAAGKQLAEQLGDAPLAQMEARLAANVSTAQFWLQYLGGRLSVPPEMSLAAPKAYADALLGLLRRKVAAPLEPLKLDAEYASALAAYNDFLAELDEYNAVAREANKQIELRRSQVVGLAVADATRDVLTAEALQKRFEPQVKRLCDDLMRQQAKKTAMEAERDRIKLQLDGLSDKTVGTYQGAINKYLDAFNAGFEIVRVEHNYLGGIKASYQLSINDTDVALGDEKTPDDVASFKNTLSAGDRSALALSFFLAQLDGDADASAKVVVFDDPFSSQDSFRRNQTAIEIAATAKCRQTIVLSHDAMFLKLVEEKIFGHGVKCLKLAAVGEATQVQDLELAAFVRTQAQNNCDTLQRYFSAHSGRPEDVIQKIRPLLEHWCRSVALTSFATDDNLGGILSKITAAGEAHPLWTSHRPLSDLNDYTCRTMHADGTLVGPLEETELRGYVKKTLRIVGAC